MTLEEVKKELEVFNKFTFFEEDHHYECNGKRVGVSVTRLIEEYSNPFDQQAIAEKVALRDNKDITQVLQEWEYKNKFACEKGHFAHEFAQSLWSGIIYQENIKSGLEDIKTPLNKIKQQAINFYNDFKDKFIHIQDEQLVGSEEYDISSAVDHLFLDNEGNVWLIDYKTNSILKGYNDDEKNRRYTKKMLIPLQNLKDDSLNHYYLQLSIYKYLIEKYTNIKIYKTMIVYMSENVEKYELIETPYLENETKEILEIRRVKDMKCIPVFIMGASGTGKTYSFKNLPPEYTGIISVAKSTLPFRNKTHLSFYQCDNYNEIENIIKNTDKKIICLDDSGYLMQFENFEKATIKGYDKHTEMAKHYADLLNTIRKIDGEKIVYVTIHEDVIDGIAKPKTTGKMINDNLCIEGLLNIVFRSLIKDGQYVFQTRSLGDSVAKTPEEMFEEDFIPNDLAEIDKVIREYYEFEPLKINKEEEKKVEEDK